MTDDPKLASGAGSALTLTNIEAEGERLVQTATDAGLTLRLLGGVAVRLLCPSASMPPLQRTYGDLDYIAPQREWRALQPLLEAAGYTGERRFNALHSGQRMLFVDAVHDRTLDVFLGVFRMCHTLDLDGRLAHCPLTLAPADLLLTKLQIVKLNMKDVLDALALLLDYEVQLMPVGDPCAAIDGSLIARVCSEDWGWYATATDNLQRIGDIGAATLPPILSAQTGQRIKALQDAVVAAPKSSKWRMRALVGRRVAWYEEPEDVR
jgi:hypothetical protein